MTGSARVLVIEDEKNVGSTLVERLGQEGYEVAWARSVEDARLELTGRRFDLALVDVGLPDGSGFTVGKMLKDQHRSTAIVFLTAFGSPEDRVRGLELGAEDYIVKPFHFKELLLRIQNALKRARYLAGSSDEDVRIGRAVFHFARFEVDVGGTSQPLTHKECALMKLLVERRGRTVSRDEILSEVWAKDEIPNSRTIDNFIMRLRRLVELDPENPHEIRSIRGIGYQLENERKP